MKKIIELSFSELFISVPALGPVLWRDTIWSAACSYLSACVYSAVKRTSHSQRMVWTFTTGNTVLCWDAAMNADRYAVTFPKVLACLLVFLKEAHLPEDFVYSSALCSQVVEIASLTEHLLGECESRSKFSQCPRCSEAVATEDLTRHVQGPACNSEFSVSLFHAIGNIFMWWKSCSLFE